MSPRAINLPKDNSFFLFGARGTGRTSLLEARYPRSEALWIDLLDPKEERRFAKNPALLDVVHHEIESRGVLFALTGSSARKLRRGAANLLAGRAFVFSLHPLTAF
jgi:hypothetical protein